MSSTLNRPHPQRTLCVGMMSRCLLNRRRLDGADTFPLQRTFTRVTNANSKCPGVNVINKFEISIAMQCRNRALELPVPKHVTYFNQSELLSNLFTTSDPGLVVMLEG